jgi:large subunit ribosomal protein L18
MKRTQLKIKRRSTRKAGIRKGVFGGPDRPRMTVFRSSKHMYVQVIDDLSGRTLASASTLEKDAKASNGSNKDAATAVGKSIAERAKAAGVTVVAFDRNGFRFHGRVKALADSAREGGLKF